MPVRSRRQAGHWRLGIGVGIAAVVAVAGVAACTGGSGEHGTSTIPGVPTSGSGGNPGTPAAEQALLATRSGFGGNVTGGAGGRVVHVTTNADSGAGSLRSALAGTTPRWIVFDHDMTITLATALRVGSNVTIDGRGHDVRITGPGHDGLDLIHDSNVIVESLTLYEFGNPARTAENDLPDAIHLDHARGVWIDHCDLSRTGDKLIAVSNGSSGITVSWNHFHDQLQVMQVGNQATAADDRSQTVTVDYNYFDSTGYRNPVVSYGYAHVYDNYYFDWQSYAVRVQRGGRMYLEDNIFYAGDNPRAALTRVHANGCNDAGTRCDDRSGELYAVGNLLLNGAKLKASTSQSPAVGKPSGAYRSLAQPASEALALHIAAMAGPQPS